MIQRYATKGNKIKQNGSQAHFRSNWTGRIKSYCRFSLARDRLKFVANCTGKEPSATVASRFVEYHRHAPAIGKRETASKAEGKRRSKEGERGEGCSQVSSTCVAVILAHSPGPVLPFQTIFLIHWQSIARVFHVPLVVPRNLVLQSLITVQRSDNESRLRACFDPDHR